MNTFKLEVLPAGDGDCLLLTWGDAAGQHHAVIDGGRRTAYPHLRTRLKAIATAGEDLDLYVLTHIDADHISGALAYAEDAVRPVDPKEVWYNGFEETRSGGIGTRSEQQGDEYREFIDALEWPLNTHFTDRVASIESSPGQIDIAGLRITLLSPNQEKLAKMSERWTDWRREKQQPIRVGTLGKKPVPDPLVVEDLLTETSSDTEAPNGASIAFIAEWCGKRILFSGDAHPDALVEALSPLAQLEGGRYRVDLLKVSHHGSKKNISKEFLDLIDCKQFVLSTNGKLHGHPDPEAIAKILSFNTPGMKQLYFNYRSDRTTPWDDAELMSQHNYTCCWPTAEDPGRVLIDLSA